MVILHSFLYVYQRVTVGAHLVPTNHISFNFNPFQAQCDPSLAAAKPELVMVSCLTAYMHGARSTRAFVQLAMDLKGLRHPPPSFKEPLKCTCSKWCNKPNRVISNIIPTTSKTTWMLSFSTKSQQHPKYIFQNHNLSNLKNRPFVSSQRPICQSAGLNRAQLIP